MSMHSERARMLQMAQHWLELAKKADEKAARGQTICNHRCLFLKLPQVGYRS
jgi:hypothetical protein